jgi:hypothetical protein
VRCAVWARSKSRRDSRCNAPNSGALSARCLLSPPLQFRAACSPLLSSDRDALHQLATLLPTIRRLAPRARQPRNLASRQLAPSPQVRGW